MATIMNPANVRKATQHDLDIAAARKELLGRGKVRKERIERQERLRRERMRLTYAIMKELGQLNK